jgi:hypothetical protein
MQKRWRRTQRSTASPSNPSPRSWATAQRRRCPDRGRQFYRPLRRGSLPYSMHAAPIRGGPSSSCPSILGPLRGNPHGGMDRWASVPVNRLVRFALGNWGFGGSRLGNRPCTKRTCLQGYWHSPSLRPLDNKHAKEFGLRTLYPPWKQSRRFLEHFREHLIELPVNARAKRVALRIWSRAAPALSSFSYHRANVCAARLSG